MTTDKVPTAPLTFFDETTDTIAAYREINDSRHSTELETPQQRARNDSNYTSPAGPSRVATPSTQVDPGIDVPDSLSPSSVPVRSYNVGHGPDLSVSSTEIYARTPISHSLAVEIFSGTNRRHLRASSIVVESLDNENSTIDTFLRAILVRYYTENLGHWFDQNDPLRHFTRIVPLRSRHSRPLLNAILTASARQLVRARCHRNEAGQVQWQNYVLLGLNEELVMQIQNECIRELLELSFDPEEVTSPDLLAAAVILRTDEEMDSLFREDGADDQVFLKVTQAYINAQVTCLVSRPPESRGADSVGRFSNHGSTRSLRAEHAASPDIPSFPVSYESIHPPPDEHSGYSPSLEENSSRALRQACFWAACRQDVNASMIKQRPIYFPLEYCNALRSLAAAEDYVWTIRTIIFCADVLEFCYGRRSGGKEAKPSCTDHQRWRILSQRATDIATCLPASFEPAYFHEPNVEAGEVFPQIWFQDPCYATGTGHLELAQILLTAFDPSVPKLGLGKLASRREMSKKIKAIVLRLCGIAMSNRKTPPNLINAFVAIVAYGEYFTDPREQTAMLHLMDSMQYEFAYHTERISNGLQAAWQLQIADKDKDQQ